MNTKFTTMNQKITLNLSALKSSWYMDRFFRYDKNLWRKVAPHENPEKPAKKCPHSASKYQRYTKFTSSRYMFWSMTNTMKLVKISLTITKDFKIQYGRQLW